LDVQLQKQRALFTARKRQLNLFIFHTHTQNTSYSQLFSESRSLSPKRAIIHTVQLETDEEVLRGSLYQAKVIQRRVVHHCWPSKTLGKELTVKVRRKVEQSK